MIRRPGGKHYTVRRGNQTLIPLRSMKAVPADADQGMHFIGCRVYTRIMQWWPRGCVVILGVVSLMASPIGMLAQCPRAGYLHFVFKPDPPARHAAFDEVAIEGAPDLEGSIRTEVGTWVERNPSEESGEVDVTIQGEDPEWLAAQRAKMEEESKRGATKGDSDWIAALQETVTDVLRDNGYFRAQVTVEKIFLSSDADQDHFSLAIRVSEGNQYRLSDIQIKGAHVFPPWELRNQIPLRDGAIFDLGKLRKGVENLTKLYEPLGYIDFTASPDVETDEAHQHISVTLDLDEDKLFTVGRVEVLGLAPAGQENELKMRIKTGDAFNPELVDEFFRDNKPVLPLNVSKEENAQISQNALYNTVDVVFDFRSCP